MRVAASGILLAVLSLLAVPTVQACHASTTTHAGAIVTDEGPYPARIAFPLGACEGTIDVQVTVENGSTPFTETIEATLTVEGPAACLPWDPCAPRSPHAASFELTSSDGRLNLTGAAANGLHLTETVTLTGTYQGDPAAFTFLKPI